MHNPAPVPAQWYILPRKERTTSIQLSLPPELEAQLRQRSEQVGLTPDQYVADLLTAQLTGNPSTPASTHASTLGFLGARAEAYLKMTPEELAAADQEFEQLKQNMNETRRLEGRPPAFY